jgi:hypothetical protein
MTTPTPVTLDVEFLTACPVCDCPDIHPALSTKWKDNDITYGVCADCGQMFLNPRMTDEQTAQYYSGQYRDLTEGEGGISDQNLTTQKSRATLQHAVMSPFLPAVSSHLELGCSGGFLLDAFHALDSLGIEPDVRYHGLPVASKYPVIASITQAVSRPFDLISMSHVLEHFNHPLGVLQFLAGNFTDDNTRFLIEVPNTEWEAVATISHPLAFNVVTLCRLFGRIGYRAAAVMYHGLGVQYPKYLLALFERKHEIQN